MSKIEIQPPKIEFDDGQRIIQTKIPNPTLNDSSSYPNDYYELQSLTSKIKSFIQSKQPPKILNIALQFPIHTIYKDSSRICTLLTKSLEEELEVIEDVLVFVVGDNNFDSTCCDNIVSAQHLDADLLIHFGHACYSSVNDMPVLYAGKLEFVLSSFIAQVQDTVSNDKKLLVFYESVYHHIVPTIKQSLLSIYNESSLVIAQIAHYAENKPDYDQIGSYAIALPKSDKFSNYTIFYISSKPYNPKCNYNHIRYVYPELCTILLSTTSGPNSSDKCYVYHPNSIIREQSITPIRKLISRRYYQIEKTKLSQIIGIVIHSYNIPNLYKNMIKLVHSIHSQNKTAYIIVVGKISVTKLANFAEMDAFIIMGCPEMTVSALLQDEDFYVPIITPFEWTFIAGNYEWDGFYSLDDNVIYNRLESSKKDSDDEPYFSMISGKYESSTQNQIQNDTSGTIIEYKKYDANEFLSMREYQGASPNIGCDNDEMVVYGAIEGKCGIASEYTCYEDSR